MVIQFVEGQRKLRKHNKSRRGCSQCKQRRVKCCERRPVCDNCARRGYACLYIPTDKTDQISRTETPPLQLSVSISEHGLRLTELKLLHHFLIYAHPHLPIGKESAWTTEVPCQATEYPHLMHAILSLSAAHLSSYDTSIAPSVLLAHRQKALTWLSNVLTTRDNLTDVDLETASNISMVLMFQTAYMNDTFYEFMQLLRGTGALAIAKLRRGIYRGPVSTVTTLVEVNNVFQHIPIDCRIPQAAEQSLLISSHLYSTNKVLQEFHRAELNVAHALERSPFEGYIAIWNLYTALTTQPLETSSHILDNQDPLAKILQVHLLSFGIIATPIRLYEFAERAKYHPMGGMIAWIEDICESLDTSFSQYTLWPSQVCKAVRDFEKAKGRISASDLATLILDRPDLFLMPARC